MLSGGQEAHRLRRLPPMPGSLRPHAAASTDWPTARASTSDVGGHTRNQTGTYRGKPASVRMWWLFAVGCHTCCGSIATEPPAARTRACPDNTTQIRNDKDGLRGDGNQTRTKRARRRSVCGNACARAADAPGGGAAVVAAVTGTVATAVCGPKSLTHAAGCW